MFKLPRILLCLALAAPAAQADESVVVIEDGKLSYLLTTKSAAPKYTMLGFPGGSGIFNARVEDGQIRFAFTGNFVVRTRNIMVDDEFAMAITDSTSLPEVMGRVVADLKRRFPGTKIYLISTSNGTTATYPFSSQVTYALGVGPFGDSLVSYSIP